MAHPDYPALILASYLLGGTSTARLPARVREKEGLSYSTGSGFGAINLQDDAAWFQLSAIFAPQNRERVERALREELQRALRDGFTAAEVKAGGRAYAETRRLQRAQDQALASRLAEYSFVGRTFAWDVAFEAKLTSLTAAEVNAALRKYIDPSRLSVVAAGDFRKPAASSGGPGSPPAASPGAGAPPASPASPRPSAAGGG